MNRSKKLEWARAFIATHQIRSVLVVGVGPPTGVNNLIEHQLAEDVPTFVASGLHSRSEVGHLWPEYVEADALALPYAPAEFDLVFSNAVIEHVGGEAAQRQFLKEHARVGRHWVATTPNRAFPIEAHFYSVCSHWRDAWYDTHPTVTRLLTPASFRAILPGEGMVRGSWVSMTLTAHSVS